MSNLATTELLSNGFSNKNSFDFDDLINCANGKLFGPGSDIKESIDYIQSWCKEHRYGI